MPKKLIVLDTFEQGLPRNAGGVLKLFKTEKGGTPAYPVEETEHGLVVTLPDGKKRTIPPDVAKKIAECGLVRLEEA